MTILTQELADLLFPEHGRTSCSDTNPENGWPHSEDGRPRCHRCMVLENLGEPLANFKIEASIRMPPDPVEVRRKALEKLSAYERQVLGL